MEKIFRHLSIKFGLDPGEEVCLILCEPLLCEIFAVLNSLVDSCKDVPKDLAALALGNIQANATGEAATASRELSIAALYAQETIKEPLETSDNCDSTDPNVQDQNVADDDTLLSGIVKKRKYFADPKINRRAERKRTKATILTPSKMRKRMSIGTNDPLESVKDEPIESKPGTTWVSCGEKIEESSITDRIAELKELLLKGQAFTQRKNSARAFSCNLCLPAADHSAGRLFTELTLRWHKRTEHGHEACRQCRDLFSSAQELRQHICPMKNLGCELCTPYVVFRSAIGWLKHHRKVHEGQKHVCHVCGQHLSDADCLRRHIGTRHPPAGQRSLPCHICGKQLKNKETLVDHERRAHRERTQACQFCGQLFASGFNLRRHVAAKHRAEMVAEHDGGELVVKLEQTLTGESSREEMHGK